MVRAGMLTSVMQGLVVDPLVDDLAGMMPDPGVIEESHRVINNWAEQQHRTAEAILVARRTKPQRG